MLGILWQKLGFYMQSSDYCVEKNKSLTKQVKALIKGKENFGITVFNTMVGCSNICFVNITSFFGWSNFSKPGRQRPKALARRNMVPIWLLPINVLESHIDDFIFSIINLLGWRNNKLSNRFGVYLNGSIDYHITRYLKSINAFNNQLLKEMRLWIILHEIGHLHNSLSITIDLIISVVIKFVSLGILITIYLLPILTLLYFTGFNTYFPVAIVIYSSLLLQLTEGFLNWLKFKVGYQSELDADRYAQENSSVEISCHVMDFFSFVARNTDINKPSFLEVLIGDADPHPANIIRKETLLKDSNRI